MTAFADSSVVVKRYAVEASSEAAGRLRGPLFVSGLARVEVVSALTRKHRAGGVSADDLDLLVAEFDADWADGVYVVIATTPHVLCRAAEQARRFGLRALDAVQLASALLARDTVGVSSFAGFDRRLNRAAAACGFELAV